MLEVSGVRVVDVLYRVSTRAQEAEGESLFNQRREVEEKWAAPLGIAVRRRIEVAESGKSALRLKGDAFIFNRRAEYTELIVEYQNLGRRDRPDAVVIDWADRWSRNVLEYAGLVTAFRVLGIRLLAIGDGLDLTDPRNDLVTHVRAAVGQEQLRITRQKVAEARRSRRERGRWQGGATADGFRTHARDCDGLRAMAREGPDGRRHDYKVRACGCDQTVLHRDPAREATITEVWRMLATSPLSWQAMADDLNDRGYRRPNGKAWTWNALYRTGENPHYAGVMTSERWVRDQHDGTIERRRPLAEQRLERVPEHIPEPYVDEAVFWDVQAQRYGKQTRLLPRAKNGSVSELTGILRCPECQTIMTSVTAISAKLCGSGVPRKSPRKRYVYARCPVARGRRPTCGNRQQVRVDVLSRLFVAEIAATVSLPDDAIHQALSLRRNRSSASMLEAERKRLVKDVEASEGVRHRLTRLHLDGLLTQRDFEEELFAYRRDRSAAEERIRAIDTELAQEHAVPDFARARGLLRWLETSWVRLTVIERAEALRLFIRAGTYGMTGTTAPTVVRITTYGPALVETPRTPTLNASTSIVARRSVP